MVLMQGEEYARSGAQTGVVVARGWGGARVTVPLAALEGWHIAVQEGGRCRRLPKPMLGAYMSCDTLPEGVAFDHDCAHRPGLHRIKVVVPRVHNERGLYARLRALGARRVHSLGHRRYRPAW
jgi:hypothetical protein